MTKQDSYCLYWLTASFFIQGDLDKRDVLLTDCHMALDSSERDLEQVSCEGNQKIYTS